MRTINQFLLPSILSYTIMPPQRSVPTQRRISFAPTTPNLLNLRGTLRRNRNTIQNYAQLERINELIENPAPTPCHPHPPRPTAEDDVDITDGDENEEEQEVEEDLLIDQSRTPTRRNLPSTVVIKTRRQSRKP